MSRQKSKKPQKSKRRNLKDYLFGRQKRTKEKFPKTKRIDNKPFHLLETNPRTPESDRKIYRKVGFSSRVVEKGDESAMYLRKKR